MKKGEYAGCLLPFLLMISVTIQLRIADIIVVITDQKMFFYLVKYMLVY